MNKSIIDKNLLLSWGGNLKNISDEGVLEGKAIVFGSEESPDQSEFKDFFTKDTYVHPEDSFTTPLFIDHGLYYSQPIGKALVYLEEDGWKAMANLDMNNEIVKSKFPEIKKGGWGFSTGAVGHVVEREKKSNGTHHIKQWVAGELSITETPAEPKALIHSVKSLYKKDEIEDENSIELNFEQINEEVQKMISSEVSKIQVQLDELKESLLMNEGENNNNDDELTVLKLENSELKNVVVELQSSFDEKEALLSEKMALLSETEEKLNSVNQEHDDLREELNELKEKIRNKDEEIKLLKSTNSSLSKINFKF